MSDGTRGHVEKNSPPSLLHMVSPQPGPGPQGWSLRSGGLWRVSPAPRLHQRLQRKPLSPVGIPEKTPEKEGQEEPPDGQGLAPGLPVTSLAPMTEAGLRTHISRHGILQGQTPRE